MKLEHAKKGILELWRRERKGGREDDYSEFFMAVRSFYDKLERSNGELLSFSWLGDKWPVVVRWIHEEEGYTQY